jgi:hypothetical protein
MQCTYDLNYMTDIVNRCTQRSKGFRTEFFTEFLPTPSTGPRLNIPVETFSQECKLAPV